MKNTWKGVGYEHQQGQKNGTATGTPTWAKTLAMSMTCRTLLILASFLYPFPLSKQHIIQKILL
jgi:predicted CxxxxCH...CXXCH cytochrome family protein